jgi:hypothetical protein
MAAQQEFYQNKIDLFLIDTGDIVFVREREDRFFKLNSCA